MKTPFGVAPFALLLGCVAFSLVATTQAQTVDWVRQLGSKSGDTARCISTDAQGNVYVSGNTDGELAGLGTNQWAGALFVCKYDRKGQLLWTQLHGTDSIDISKGISADALGNVFVVGYTGGDIEGSKTELADNNAFICMYNASGSLIWTKLLQPTKGRNSICNGVVTDDRGNAYISGEFSGGIGTPSNLFVAKYNCCGVLLWMSELKYKSHEKGKGISVEPRGNIYIIGSTDGCLMGPDSCKGNHDAFIGKYNKDGKLIWLNQFGTTAADIGSGITVDRWGNIYVTGSTNGDMDGDGPDTPAGAYDAFLRKYDSNGKLIWSRQLGSNNWDKSFAVATDRWGNIYISGETRGDLEGKGAKYNGHFDVFVAMYDSHGKFLWVKQLGTDEEDEASYGVTVNRFGNVYLAGFTNGEMAGKGSHIGMRDLFVAKIQGPEVCSTDLDPKQKSQPGAYDRRIPCCQKRFLPCLRRSARRAGRCRPARYQRLLGTNACWGARGNAAARTI